MLVASVMLVIVDPPAICKNVHPVLILWMGMVMRLVEIAPEEVFAIIKKELANAFQDSMVQDVNIKQPFSKVLDVIFFVHVLVDCV